MAKRGGAERLPDREVFTTGEVARLCNVTIRTVIRWVDSGALKGYRIPGSRERRIPRATLVDFLRAHDVPLGELERPRGRRRVLIVDDEPEVLLLLRRWFEQLGLFDVDVAANAYEAGAKTVSFRPDLLLIDYNLGDSTGLDVARTVRADPGLAHLKIVCMSGFLTGPAVDDLLRQGVDDFVAKPVDLPDLRDRVYRLLEIG